MQEYVSTTEAAKLLDVDAETLRLWGLNGKIQIIVDSPRRRKVSMNEINRILSNKLPANCKECTICGLVDHKDKFAPNRNKCIYCYNNEQKERRDKIPKKVKQRKNREKYEKTKDRCIERATIRYQNKKNDILLNIVLKRYNISYEQYIVLQEKNDSKCYICNKIPSRGCVDHDHDTGKIRGYLCGKCNSALGFFQDDINIISNALKYLQNFDIEKENHCEYSGYYYAGKKGVPLIQSQ